MKPVTSIRHKMMRVVMTTTLVALLLSAAALLVYELQNFRETRVEDLKTQADLVARASAAALVFDDPRVARENLQLLSLRPQIEAAAIYRADARLFALYTAPGQARAAPVLGDSREGYSFDAEHLMVRQRIEQNGELLGTIVLRAQYDLLGRLRDYLAILALVTLVSLLLASLVARRLQRSVTDPIVAVAEVAREVVQQRNYALRADKTTNDEVGALVEAFNDMLRELGGQAAALQAADRRKDEFLATLAHELRNPLAPIGNALVILSRDDADPALRQRMREIMQRQLKQMVRLIDDLLEVSRISTGRLELRMEPLDLVEVLQAAVEAVQPELRERGHALVASWPPPTWVNGDRTRLAQVFVNLLNNAAKYTDRGGRIEIAWALGEAEVEVRVVDNGMGIAPAMQAEVFEMFVQVDKSLERGRAGLGVGLALSRQLVELHGGRIRLESRGLGQGSTFAVTLARMAGSAPVASAPPATEAAPAAPRRLRILLADDNADFADSLAHVLEASGHTVQVVYEGRAALAAARATRFDAGLFDIGMPGLNGYELAATLRAERGANELFLVALTGWGQTTDQERARTAGFDRHFVKPVDMAALIELLAERAAIPA
ncbi:MAG: response regulator [Burkholderiales bacterium]|nr:response regulator [Burkholderiales bacterium]